MVFNINIGFSGLTNSEATEPQSKEYALFIGDTVVVNAAGDPAQILTNNKKKLKNTVIFLKDEDEEGDDAASDKEDEDENLLGRSRRNAVLDSKLRTEHSAEDKRKQNQKELAAKLNEDARLRLAARTGSRKQEK
ncbi:SUPT16H [Cordylochernes scorpioides]|uniref:FACT complex subunit n=1 Tax=Cordylochernes scorpioides TaxID=51811 RepID=A0ABY6KFR7_9ARAC|nr:SUPT16H [Cordylochernes scorpioides]